MESMHKQCHLEDVVGNRAWSLSLDASSPQFGKLCFGDDLAFDCQVLGTESYDSSTWLWSWANASVPAEVTEAARALSTRPDVPPEFKEAQFPLSRATGHQIAAIARGMLSAPAYYSGPTGPSGRIFFLVTDRAFPVRAPDCAGDLARVVRCIGQTLELPSIKDLGWLHDRPGAVEAFMRRLGAKQSQDGHYQLPSGGWLKAELSRDGDLRAFVASGAP